VKTVVFGSGYWGRNYVRELAGNVVATIEPDEEHAEYVRNTYNVPTYPELPDDLDFDAACIVTPPDTHIDLAEPLAKQGKYVLIEKPLAISTEEAMRLYPYRERIMSASLYMYHPSVYVDMKDWVKTFPVNHAFSRRTNHGPIRPWQNAMWDLAIHDVSVFNYLFGKPIGVEATGEYDWVLMRVNYTAVSAAIYASWLGGPKHRTIELVPADVENGDRFIFDDIRVVLEITPLRRMLDAFLSGSWDRCTLDEGIEVLQVLEAARL
jgi:predicted dehydrogenase